MTNPDYLTFKIFQKFTQKIHAAEMSTFNEDEIDAYRRTVFILGQILDDATCELMQKKQDEIKQRQVDLLLEHESYLRLEQLH